MMKTYQRKTITSFPGLGYQLFALFILFVMLPGTIKAQWNNNTYVNEQISTLTVADMQTASTSDGKTWIAFYVQNGSNYDMRAQLIDANGYKLLGTDGILVSNEPSGSATYVFNVCVDASNNLIIAYQDIRSGPEQAVLFKISEAGTQQWGATGIVLGLGLSPYPAVLSTGETVVAWNEASSNTLYLQKISTSGTIVWSTPVQILVGSTTTTRGQVIANTSGKFSVVYQKRGTGVSTTLYAQMYDNTGTALYSPLQICNQTTAAYDYYSIAAEADTTYFGYYSSSGSRFNSFLQRINPGGTIPWGMNGSNFNTSTGGSDNYQMQTAINITPGSNYVWSVCTFSNTSQTQYGVYIQKFLKTTGARQFTDQAKVVYAISASSDQLCGNLALVNDTPMFMSYDVNYKIYATRLDATGNFVWPGNRVELSSTTSTIGKMRYGFTPDGPNRCAGTWTENRSTAYLGYAQGISIGGLIGIKVATQGNVPAVITTNGGTLQMVDTVFPGSANQSATWSIVPGTGQASISTSGLVTAIANGTVYAKAVAVQDVTVKDSLMITITGQVPQAPTVITLAATGITFSGATLNGSVNANNSSTTVTFNWGLTTAYGNTINATPSTVTGNTPTPVLANITGLSPLTTYHFRVTGTNSAGTSYGNDLTFTTLTAAPTVVTNAASNISGNNATLNGTVNANTFSTSVSFDYGLTTTYGTNVAGTPTPVTGNTPTPVSAAISGLTVGLTYHFRCNGTNSYGTTNGNDMSFVAGCQLPGSAGTITGPSNVCVNATNVGYSVGSIPNATTYTWTVPTGANIVSGQGTQSITVNFGTTSGNVTVIGSNSCGSGNSSSLAVTVNPLPVPTITGTSTLCVNSGNYAYSTETGMTNYIWAVSSGGSISSGQGTATVQVNWVSAGAQTVSVNYTNASGCQAATPTVFNVTVNAVPGPAGSISGPDTLCAGTTGVNYSVATITNAVTYIWTLPSGASIVSGAGTNSITVDFSLTATSGNISVYGNDFCGDGPASSLPVTINPIPPTPVVTYIPFYLTSSAPVGNQWYFQGTLIPGATGQTYNPLPGIWGYYWTIVTINNCSSDTSNHIFVYWEGINSNSSSAIEIYPVPNDGQFNVSITTASKESFSISVYNDLGIKIYEEPKVDVNGSLNKVIDLRPVANGVYTVIFENSLQKVVKKIVVNN
jgi:hypothetical protein